MKLQIKTKIESEKSIKVSPFRKEIRKTTPHKHNSYFEIIYLSAGKGYHGIDSKKYAVKPPVIFCVRKEQVHHWELSKEADGFVLILKKSFLDNSLDNGLKLLLEKLSGYSCLHLKEQKSIDSIFTLLVEECKNESISSFEVTEGLLKSLMAKILQVAKPQEQKKETKSNLYQSFRELLNGNSGMKNNVAYYAELLNTSPQNLNAACRKAANLSATDVLSEFIISETKRLLIYTNNTVSEISFILDFKDVSHFVKYFKRFTGNTPQSFRSSQV
jgi:AraC family transcriptional activator of pobA